MRAFPETGKVDSRTAAAIAEIEAEAISAPSRRALAAHRRAERIASIAAAGVAPDPRSGDWGYAYNDRLAYLGGHDEDADPWPTLREAMDRAELADDALRMRFLRTSVSVRAAYAFGDWTEGGAR